MYFQHNFYNSAFIAEEKARIQTTNVDNSVASTGYSSNQYGCTNTNDRVFLLNYARATNASYGLSTTTARQLKPSAYAQSQGVYTDTSTGNSYWWLRSLDSSYNDYARFVLNADVIDSSDVDRTYYGVVPALWISL